MRDIRDCGRGSLTRLEDLAWLIETKYKEMPGMRLTLLQIRRLFSPSGDDCRKVLDYLVSAGHFVQDADGRFCLEVDDNSIVAR